MSDYLIEAATKEEWAERALRAEAENARLRAEADANLAELLDCLRYYGEGTGDMGEYARTLVAKYGETA